MAANCAAGRPWRSASRPAAGGGKYAVLATAAGAGYGWVYERTQRVEASVLTHFALNTLHFFLFTYPALAR